MQALVQYDAMMLGPYQLLDPAAPGRHEASTSTRSATTGMRDPEIERVAAGSARCPKGRAKAPLATEGTTMSVTSAPHVRGLPRRCLPPDPRAALAGDDRMPKVPTQPTSTARDKGQFPYAPVVTPNGGTLPWTMVDGVKEFHLVAEPVKREFAPGMIVNCWGYNGSTPGPTIEAVEGDRVRIFVTNKLPERTSVHWHGILLPNGMDGVAGLNQPHIEPGETYVYEFTLRQHGTHMYHPHSDEMVQMALGMMGFFVIHPKAPETPRVDRDFAIMLHEWFDRRRAPRTPNPNVMTDFNIVHLQQPRVPGHGAAASSRRASACAIRFGNLSMDSHPIHLHGYRFEVTGTDGGPIPQVGALARDDGERAGRHDARRRVRRRRAGRLGVPLPQVAPHDERDGPRRART